MTAISARTILAVGCTLVWAGCYHDLDYGDGHLKCDATAKNPCPDGFLCSTANRCVRAPGALDAPLSEGGLSPADGADTDQLAIDATTLEASPPVDVSTQMEDVANVVDTSLATTLDGTAADKPEEISTGGDGGVDSIASETGAPLPDAGDAAVLDMEPG